MTEKFIADFNKPRIGSEFVYVGKKRMSVEEFTRLAATAFAKAEMLHGVSLGAMNINMNTLTGTFEATVHVTRVLPRRVH